MDVTAGADSGSVDDVGAADGLASQNETYNDPGDHEADAHEESAPAASPSQETKQESEFVNVPGFGRVHRDDAQKAREFVKGAYGAFEKANFTEKQLKAAQADPEAFLEKLGVDVDSIAGKRLARKLEMQLQTPEQQKQTEQERAYAEREAKLKEREEALQTKELDELTKREIQTIDKDWSEALEASGLPKHRGNLKRMAVVARDYLAKGIDVPAAHLAEIVRDEKQADEQWHQKQRFEETSDEEFAQYMSTLGPKALERVRTFLLSQVRNPTTSQAQRQQRSSPAPRPPSQKTGASKIMTEAEFRQWMNK